MPSSAANLLCTDVSGLQLWLSPHGQLRMLQANDCAVSEDEYKRAAQADENNYNAESGCYL